jgi:leucyl aminopeptidase
MNFQVIEIVSSKHSLLIPFITKDLETKLQDIVLQFGLSSALLSDFKAGADEVVVLYPHAQEVTEKIILLGLGDSFSVQSLQKSMRLLVNKQKEKLGQHIVIDLGKILAEDAVVRESETINYVESCVSASLLATYDIAKFKTKDNQVSVFPENFSFILPKSAHEITQKAIRKGEVLASTQQHIFDLVNLPANHLNALQLAKFAENIGKEHHFEVRVLHLEEITQLGMGGLIAINQGSDTPPTFTIMEYKPVGDKPLKKVGLVGKGVTFDTGGISIKDSDGMWQMKCDMAGAAVVIGTMEAVARLQLPVHLIGIVPSTDNMINGKAIHPGDIVNTYSGLTIEIEDTDAEGRVILADGLAYLHKNYEPDVIIDLATLTGACVVALGYHAAGLFSNNDELAAQLASAGAQTNERVWRLPLWDDYDKHIKSDMADVKNYGGRPAGAITAAKFLEKFVGKHTSWAHLDIAGVAFGDSPFSNARSATGYGLRLLVAYIENSIK